MSLSNLSSNPPAYQLNGANSSKLIDPPQVEKVANTLALGSVTVVTFAVAAAAVAGVYYSQPNPQERARVLQEFGEWSTTQFGALGQDLFKTAKEAFSRGRNQLECLTALVMGLLPKATPAQIPSTVTQVLQQAKPDQSPPPRSPASRPARIWANNYGKAA